MKNYEREHEMMRRQCWIEVCVATAGSANCEKVESPTKFADAALAAFDERFAPVMDEDEWVAS